MNALPRAAEARIGPNAITQLVAALDHAIGRAQARAAFAAAGLEGYLASPPVSMIPEAHVRALHAELRGRLTRAQCDAMALEAGERTGDYLLAHRIPAPVQCVLAVLPCTWSARLLARAIGGHAWTFAGSGMLRVERQPGLAFVLHDCPLCRGAVHAAPACGYFAATFERLYRRLVDPAVSVQETECVASGGAACRFEVRGPGCG